MDTQQWREPKNKVSLLDLRREVLDVGEWMQKSDYKGFDSPLPDTPMKLSTTLSFSLEGWMALYRHTGRTIFIEEAARCVDAIISEQNQNGLWLSPFPFRGNVANHPYACENFMSIRPLVHYYKSVESRQKIKNSVYKALTSILRIIGHSSDGCFWYSPTDKIFVPNISSMAASTFADMYQITGNEKLLERAKLFARYCTNNQREDGGYNYFSDQDFVYIPYHALEIWELNNANKILKDPEIENSLKRATDYMDDYFIKYFYDSRDDTSGFYTTSLFKTPIWMSKAFLSRGFVDKAAEHLVRGQLMFSVPKEKFYYYLNSEINFGRFKIKIPNYKSVYMRYNASCFEVGSKLLEKMGD